MNNVFNFQDTYMVSTEISSISPVVKKGSGEFATYQFIVMMKSRAEHIFKIPVTPEFTEEHIREYLTYQRSKLVKAWLDDPNVHQIDI